jgi:hypothetical protein
MATEHDNPVSLEKKIELLKAEAMNELWGLRVLLPNAEELKTKEEVYQGFIKMHKDDIDFAMFETGFARACEIMLGMAKR